MENNPSTSDDKTMSRLDLLKTAQDYLMRDCLYKTITWVIVILIFFLILYANNTVITISGIVVIIAVVIVGTIVSTRYYSKSLLYSLTFLKELYRTIKNKFS